MMIIDKTNKITKIAGAICIISAVIELIVIIKGFVLYEFIVMLANILLAFICYKSSGKDKEICLAVFGGLCVFEVIRVFTVENFIISVGMILLLRILGYVTIIVYMLRIVKNKSIPIIGGTLVSILLFKNAYDLILAYWNLQTTLGGSLGINAPVFSGSMVLEILGVLTYIVPTLLIAVLIAVGAVKFPE